ncbi:SAM-dependent methyltransferase [Streptomyces sp. NPDC088124]|uniref:SAM-dependent methyltransferase n=1 Tax=Streptomyces sp. NPDC088124 TaxID=3154654 RepID=UPI0034444D06
MSDHNDPPPAKARRLTTHASPAGTYNQYLGGKDSYPVDEEVERRMEALGVEPQLIAGQNREFHQRAVRIVADQLGINQILDIGPGKPDDSPSTHEIAQQFLPAAEVLYVDNDPIVVRHAEARLRSGHHGATHYAEIDACEPQKLLAAAAKYLDLQRPVAVLMIALLHFVEDSDQDPRHIVRTVMEAMAPGSCLVLTHLVDDHSPETWRAVEAVYREEGMPAQIRPYDRVHALFEGLDLLDPGLVPVTQWHPAPDDISIAIKPARVPLYGAIAVKL